MRASPRFCSIVCCLLLAGLCPNAAAAEPDSLVFPSSQLDQERVFKLDARSVPDASAVGAVQEERLASTLMELLPLSSRSCREQETAERTRALLEKIAGPMGIKVSIDDLPERAAKADAATQKDFFCNNGQTPPESGNLIAILPGDPDLPVWNLSIHLDTNQLSFEGMHRDGDLIRPAPGTPLGADDKAGIAIVLEILRVIAERDIRHGEIRIVGLVAEEDGAVGAKLVDGEAFKGDVVISVDGGDPAEIGRAAPTSMGGYITVRTQTSHPASYHEKKSVSACAVGAEILTRAGFVPRGHPDGHPDVVLHSYFVSCGVDGGRLTPKGQPIADYQYNTVSPFWTAAWQMRNLEGLEPALAMAAGIRKTVAEVCAEAAKGRTPVTCEITGTDKPNLTGYVVNEDAASVRLLERGFEHGTGSPVRVTAQQFGGFNGNYIKKRFDEEMLIVGTGQDQAHTNQETVSIKGMARVARGLLASMLLSYRYVRAK